MSAQKGIGRLIQLGVAAEVSRGTAVTLPAYWIPWGPDAAIESKIENAKDAQAYGIIEDHVNETRVKDWVEGSFSYNLRDQSLGPLLKSLFGQDTKTTHAGESVVYDHKFTILESAQHPTITLSKSDPLAAQNYYYANGVIHKMELNYELKKFINAKFSFAALKGQQISNQSSPSNTTENYFVPQYLTLSLASTYGGLPGSALSVKSAKITFDENVEHQEVLGNTQPADFLNKEFKVEGTIEAIWKGEADFFSNYIANTVQAIELKAVNTDVTIGNSTHPTLDVKLAKCYFQAVDKPMKVGDLVYQTIKFSAAYSLSDAEMLDITLTNTVSGAY